MSSDGFRKVESVFWKIGFSLPQDKVLKQLFQLPSDPFEVKEDFMSPDGFRKVESVFWKVGFSLPQDKVLKQLFQLPSDPFEDVHACG